MVTHQDYFEIMYHTEIAEAIEKGSRTKETCCELRVTGSRPKDKGMKDNLIARDLR